MYGKCSSFADACNAFYELGQRDVVSWYTMLAVHIEHGLPAKTLELYVQMLDEEVSPDNRTFVSLLQACGMIGRREQAVVVEGQSVKLKSLPPSRAVHAEAQKRSYSSNAFLTRTLIWVYGKCGSMLDAQIVFERLCHQDVVSWNPMPTAFVDSNLAERAVQLYEVTRR